MKPIKDFLKESLSDIQKHLLMQAIEDDNIDGKSEAVNDAIKALAYAQRRSHIVNILKEKNIYKILEPQFVRIWKSLDSIYKNIGTENNADYTKGILDSDELLSFNGNLLELLRNHNVKDSELFVKTTFTKRIPGDKSSGNGELLLTTILSDAAPQMTSGGADVPIEGKEGIEVKFANTTKRDSYFYLFDYKTNIKNILKSYDLEPIKKIYDSKDEQSVTSIFNSLLKNESGQYLDLFNLACDAIAKCINAYKKTGLVIFKGNKESFNLDILTIKDDMNGEQLKTFLRANNLSFYKFSFSKDVPLIGFTAAK